MSSKDGVITLEYEQVTAMIDYIKSFSELLAVHIKKFELLAQVTEPTLSNMLTNTAETYIEHLAYFDEFASQLETARGDKPRVFIELTGRA